MTNPKKEYKDRGILTNQEVDLMLKEADNLKDVFFQLRAKALIAIVKKFGKRRSEIARLALNDLKVFPRELEVTFHLSKKHKRGLSQFMKYCQSHDPEVLEKTLPEIKQHWQRWQATKQGHTVKKSMSLQSIDLNDKYVPFIIQYLEFLKASYPDAKYLFPSGLTVFGETYIIYPDQHLSGSQLLRIIKQLNESAWLHLFRETKGAEIAKLEGRTLDAVYKVKENLDLENEETAYRYVRRYAALKQPTER